MVKINQAVKTIEVELESIPGSKITLKDSLCGAEFERALDASQNNQLAMTFIAMEAMIVDWNLEGDDGQKLEINIDNIKKIDMLDLREALSKTRFSQRLEELEKKTRSA